jgi:tRNA(adenine34) deaminase
VARRKASEKIGSWRLDDLTLIVTLEPCVMCAGAILQSRIKRLVFGAFNEKAGAVGSIMDVIRDQRALSEVEVVNGVMDSECAQILKKYFKTKRL